MPLTPAPNPAPRCPACQTEMRLFGTYRLDATREDVPAAGEFLKSSLFLHIFTCPECRKMEFYQAQ
ncbi:MAG: hypothetical protein DIU70_010440 [Bacillota bacterium]|nr:MAG: hypothetical protein DIU70_06785 [Bacillota bacterium]